ncbi:MAG TPA: hypothetical protein DCQ30_07045 [Acidimicrobiaceae bacterium]|nr:hypothetical protein [Acidimicrobiaceae bacterium]
MKVTMHEWDCGTWNCRGVLYTAMARPADDEVVRCQPRPGAALATSCGSPMRFDAGQERFLPCPDATSRHVRRSSLNGVETAIDELQRYLNGADNANERFNTTAITAVQARVNDYLTDLTGTDLPSCTYLATVDQPWAHADRLVQAIGNARLEIQRARGKELSAS